MSKISLPNEPKQIWKLALGQAKTNGQNRISNIRFKKLCITETQGNEFQKTQIVWQN